MTSGAGGGGGGPLPALPLPLPQQPPPSPPAHTHAAQQPAAASSANTLLPAKPSSASSSMVSPRTARHARHGAPRAQPPAAAGASVAATAGPIAGSTDSPDGSHSSRTCSHASIASTLSRGRSADVSSAASLSPDSPGGSSQGSNDKPQPHAHTHTHALALANLTSKFNRATTSVPSPRAAHTVSGAQGTIRSARSSPYGLPRKTSLPLPTPSPPTHITIAFAVPSSASARASPSDMKRPAAPRKYLLGPLARTPSASIHSQAQSNSGSSGSAPATPSLPSQTGSSYRKPAGLVRKSSVRVSSGAPARVLGLGARKQLPVPSTRRPAASSSSSSSSSSPSIQPHNLLSVPYASRAKSHPAQVSPSLRFDPLADEDSDMDMIAGGSGGGGGGGGAAATAVPVSRASTRPPSPVLLTLGMATQHTPQQSPMKSPEKDAVVHIAAGVMLLPNTAAALAPVLARIQPWTHSGRSSPNRMSAPSALQASLAVNLASTAAPAASTPASPSAKYAATAATTTAAATAAATDDARPRSGRAAPSDTLSISLPSATTTTVSSASTTPSSVLLSHARRTSWQMEMGSNGGEATGTSAVSRRAEILAAEAAMHAQAATAAEAAAAAATTAAAAAASVSATVAPSTAATPAPSSASSLPRRTSSRSQHLSGDALSPRNSFAAARSHHRRLMSRESSGDASVHSPGSNSSRGSMGYLAPAARVSLGLGGSNSQPPSPGVGHGSHRVSRMSSLSSSSLGGRSGRIERKTSSRDQSHGSPAHSHSPLHSSTGGGATPADGSFQQSNSAQMSPDAVQERWRLNLIKRMSVNISFAPSPFSGLLGPGAVAAPAGGTPSGSPSAREASGPGSPAVTSRTSSRAGSFGKDKGGHESVYHVGGGGSGAPRQSQRQSLRRSTLSRDPSVGRKDPSTHSPHARNASRVLSRRSVNSAAPGVGLGVASPHYPNHLAHPPPLSVLQLNSHVPEQPGAAGSGVETSAQPYPHNPNFNYMFPHQGLLAQQREYYDACASKMQQYLEWQEDQHMDPVMIPASAYPLYKHRDSTGSNSSGSHDPLSTPYPLPPSLPPTFDLPFWSCYTSLQDWDRFDIFNFSELTWGWPLSFMFVMVLKKSDLFNRLGLDPRVCFRFIQEVESHYLPNPYHTSIHAADVLHAVWHFLNDSILRGQISDHDVFLLYLSCAIHDFAHPGVNNAFLVQSKAPLAIRYNDRHVLEAFHVSSSFRMMQLTQGCNILEQAAHGDAKVYARSRKMVIDLVLATDLATHFDLVKTMRGKFDAFLAAATMEVPQQASVVVTNPPPTATITPAAAPSSTPASADVATVSPSPASSASSPSLVGSVAPFSLVISGPPPPSVPVPQLHLTNDDDITLVLQLLLKMGDLSHPARPKNLHLRWAELVTEEFFSQGDRERSLQLQPSMFMDRFTTNVATSQRGFLAVLVQPLFDVAARLQQNSFWLAQVEKNLELWGDLERIEQEEKEQKEAEERGEVVAAATATSAAAGASAGGAEQTGGGGGGGGGGMDGITIGEMREGRGQSVSSSNGADVQADTESREERSASASGIVLSPESGLGAGSAPGTKSPSPSNRAGARSPSNRAGARSPSVSGTPPLRALSPAVLSSDTDPASTHGPILAPSPNVMSTSLPLPATGTGTGALNHTLLSRFSSVCKDRTVLSMFQKVREIHGTPGPSAAVTGALPAAYTHVPTAAAGTRGMGANGTSSSTQGAAHTLTVLAAQHGKGRSDGTSSPSVSPTPGFSTPSPSPSPTGLPPPSSAAPLPLPSDLRVSVISSGTILEEPANSRASLDGHAPLPVSPTATATAPLVDPSSGSGARRHTPDTAAAAAGTAAIVTDADTATAAAATVA